ncbi:3,4-dihydroxyphenylacetate 2,3-dioxygenase [Capillimicrobium parvum]|uniref:Manganese-dependent 2,3-dihydroxybiphenyl 1,2-dioxygenase n=1 Tax=Capillimicrobium parvum TaxID=2884022 RepID=A0A9E7C095_9ACTN|nr:3,4-dihydroxyphenylacetate 2,3-dioxygenase [Capillimicrobium parvum]UGS35292.1 Manganese-dependent 2,3-dihydroxybiphenyl 1,2-dioxygenase [Capillimicrobium parvum]
MSRVQELIGEVKRPPFDIMRAAHVELVVRDLDASLHFYDELLGMIVTERTAEAAYLRGWEEYLHHSLVLRVGDEPAIDHVSFRVAGDADLDVIAADFERRGCPVREHTGEPGQGRAIRVQDPLGFPLEFFHDMDRVDSNTQAFHLQRGAPILRFDHLNFHSPDPEAAFRFWQELGFRATEYISTDGEDEKLTGAWLRRKPTVHDVALTAGTGPRLHHFAMWLAEPSSVLRVCDQLAAGGWVEAIERGPGRHGVSNAFFVYLRDPDGHRIELYTCDYYTGDPDHPPKRWSVTDPRCRSFWGTRAPDRWYEESSVVLDLDGRVVETRAAGVDERTEIMA